MKKIKFLIASMIGAIALVFAAVLGTKINAATNCSNSTASSGTMAKGTTYVLSASTIATAEGYSETAGGKTFTKPYYQYFTLGISSNWNVDYNTNLTGGVGIRSNGGSGRTVSFTIPGGETATVTLDLYTNDKPKDNTLSYGTISKNSNSFESNYVVETESTTITAGASDTASTITFVNKIGFTSITVEISGTAASEDDKIAAAEAAITAIGTVEYTTASQTLINAAAVAIADVSDPSDNITNYSTYTAAVTAFNNLESAAISTFITSVTNIGTVSSSSGDDISAAETAYEALLASTKTNATVVSSKEILDAAKLAYADVMYDSLDKYINANSCALATDGVTSETQCANSIFNLMPTAKVNDCNATYDGVTYTQRIQTGGSVSFSGNEVSNKAVKFQTKSAGILKILAQSAKSTDTTRTLSIYKSGSKTAIFTSESGLPATTSDIKYDYISIPSAGTYYIASSVNNISIYYAEFIPESVTPLVQKATDSTYTYVRFVTIIKGVEEIDASDVTFSVTMDYADTEKDDKTVIYTPHVVKKITQSGETYVADVNNVSHTFDNSVNPTEYYVVYVLRFTTSKYSGNSIKATTTFGGTPYVSNSIEI